MSSTESSTMPLPPQSKPEKELQRGLRLREGIKRLGQMEGIDSIGQGLEWEAAAVKRQADFDHSLISGADSVNGSATADAETDDMKKTLIAGDYVVHQHYPSATPAAKSDPPAPPKQKLTNDELKAYIKLKIAEGIAKANPPAVAPTDPPVTAAATDPWYKRYALPLVAGAGILGAGGAGTTAYFLNKPAAVAPVEQTEYGFKISSQVGHGISAE